jgi:predicted nucleic acid-binding protein
MKYYFLDTNVLIYYLRQDERKTQIIDRLYAPFEAGNKLFVSIVTVAEIHSLAIRYRWGSSRWRILTNILRKMVIVPIDSQDLIDRFAEIDAFSQGKLPEKPLGMSARNMEKNDIWIAASASLLELPLLTHDGDFAHLDEHFLTVLTLQF